MCLNWGNGLKCREWEALFGSNLVCRCGVWGREEEEEEGVGGWLGCGCSERTQTLPWGQGLFVLADTFLTAVIQSFSSWLATTPPPSFFPSFHPSFPPSLLKAAKTDLSSCLLFSLSRALSFYVSLVISVYSFLHPALFLCFSVLCSLCMGIHITNRSPKK